MKKKSRFRDLFGEDHIQHISAGKSDIPFPTHRDGVDRRGIDEFYRVLRSLGLERVPDGEEGWIWKHANINERNQK